MFWGWFNLLIFLSWITTLFVGLFNYPTWGDSYFAFSTPIGLVSIVLYLAVIGIREVQRATEDDIKRHVKRQMVCVTILLVAMTCHVHLDLPFDLTGFIFYMVLPLTKLVIGVEVLLGILILFHRRFRHYAPPLILLGVVTIWWTTMFEAPASLDHWPREQPRDFIEPERADATHSLPPTLETGSHRTGGIEEDSTPASTQPKAVIPPDSDLD